MYVESVATAIMQSGPQEAIDEILETIPVAIVEIHGYMWVPDDDDDTEM